MRNLFNMDNPVFRTLGRLADLMILNICFMICCIPIVTIGAAVTGMNYVTLKIAEEEEGYIAKGFFKSFRQNFKQSTIIWLIMLVLGIILGLDFWILSGLNSTFITVMRVLLMVVAFAYLMELIYVFPVLARFDNTIKITMKNSLIMAIADFPRTILMILITVGSVILTFFNGYTIAYGILVWILCGFALVAYLNSIFMKKVFAKYMPKEEEETSDPDAWDADKAFGGPMEESEDGSADEASAVLSDTESAEDQISSDSDSDAE